MKISSSHKNFGLNAYAYGFNGMERDDETAGSGNSYDFGVRLYDSRLGRWMSLDVSLSAYSSTSDYAYVGDDPVNLIDAEGGIWRDVNGNIILTHIGRMTGFNQDPKPAGPAKFNKDGTSTRDFVYTNYDIVNIYADDGTPIQALRLVQVYVRTVSFDKNGNVTRVSDIKDIDLQKNDAIADCHGYTFASNALWINSTEVDKLLNGDGYTPTTQENTDIVIFRNKEGLGYHSATVNSDNTFNNNAGIMKTEIGVSIEEAERGLMSEAYKDAFDPSAYSLDLDYRVKSTPEVKVYDKNFIGPIEPNAIIRDLSGSTTLTPGTVSVRPSSIQKIN